MHFGDFQLTIYGKRAMICLLVLLAAPLMRGADQSGSPAAKTTMTVKPDSGIVTRMPEQLAPDGLFNSTKGSGVGLSVPRPPVVQRTPAEREKSERLKNWIDQTPEEALGGLKLDGSSGKKSLGLVKDSEMKALNLREGLSGDNKDDPSGSQLLERSRKHGKAGEFSASLKANRYEAVPCEMNFEALLKRSSSGDRLGLSSGLPGSWQGGSAFQFDAKEKERRDTRMNEVRQMFNSSAVPPASGTSLRSGFDNPTMDPLRSQLPRTGPELSIPVQPSIGPQDPRFRPAQVGLNRLPSLEVADPRNPVATPSSSEIPGESNQEKPKQQPTRLPFPKRGF